MSRVSTESRFSRRRIGGFFLGAAAFALLSFSPSGASANVGGSIALNAMICPDAVTADTALETCDFAQLGGEITLNYEDGTMYLTSADAALNDGFVWGQAGDLPMGVYLIDWSEAEFPAGYEFYRYGSWTGDIGSGLVGPYANLTPDQPSAFMSFVLIPAVTDSDGDGVDDGVEAEQGSDPFDPASIPSQYAGCPPDDSDGDGLNDCEETDFYGTDPHSTDTDSDGLTDQEEVEVYGTDPFSADTDGDGDVDASEVAYGSDPFDPADFPPGNAGYPSDDSDGDTLTDAEEVETYGTDPNSTDTDGDGASDYDEVWAGNDPLDPAKSPAGQAASAPAPSPSPAPSASGKAAVTQLPNTGVGLDEEGSASLTGVLGVLSAAALALGGFVANRRRA